MQLNFGFFDEEYEQKKYTEILQEHMDSVFNTEHGWKKCVPVGSEVYYDLVKGVFTIRVYSSIIEGKSRKRGKDAIRVCLLANVDNKMKAIRKYPRVNRIATWESNLKRRVMEAYNDYKTIPTCPRCGAPMSKRKNKTTGEEFLGCSRYPLCRSVRSLNETV
jgi:hypothetical protein